MKKLLAGITSLLALTLITSCGGGGGGSSTSSNGGSSSGETTTSSNGSSGSGAFGVRSCNVPSAYRCFEAAIISQFSGTGRLYYYDQGTANIAVAYNTCESQNGTSSESASAESVNVLFDRDCGFIGGTVGTGCPTGVVAFCSWNYSGTATSTTITDATWH
ncbi:MAG: hypothetical protein HZB29_06725 [Nitrospinae bacterium]|nr:hypothetical protein [Nitrospinota bacterium]